MTFGISDFLDYVDLQQWPVKVEFSYLLEDSP